jgi:peptidoglycan DL-endopeptidase CwlO
VVRFRALRRLARLQARLLVTTLCCAICGVVSIASGAQNPNAFDQRSGALRRENATLAQRIHAATLDLYALDSRLQRAQAELVSLSTKREEIARERLSIRSQLQTSRQNLHRSQRQLALLVHGLYEQQPNDPIALVLGAQSLDEAITTIDDLGRAAQQNRQIVAESRSAQQTLRALKSRLVREDAHLRALEAETARTAASLTATQDSRRRYVSSLAEQHHLNVAQIAAINARAHASATASVSATSTPTGQAPPTVAVEPVVVPATGARTLTVVATGYSMNGTTATGLPVGWGTVAVDPSVIPLGSRLTIAGYGEGVAADTGLAVQGATIDLWFPTVAQALAWGRRVVTVTVH